MKFYSVSGFSPILIHPVESPETPSAESETKISTFILEANASGKLLILEREDLEEINYEPNKRPWSEEEDMKLVDFREERHMEWDEISKLMPHRNPKMCYSRYKRLLESSKKIWKKKDDDKLKLLIEKVGEDWKAIER